MSTTIRILTAIGLALYAFVFSFIVAADSGWTSDERIHFTGAVLMGLALLVGMGRLILRPRDRMALVHGAVALLAVLLVQVVVGDPDNQGGQAGPYDITYLIVSIPYIVAVILALRLPAEKGGRRKLDPVLLGIGLIGLAVTLLYALDQALMQRNSWPPASDPHHNSHWATMAQIGMIPGLLVIVSALPRVGSRVQALVAAFIAVTLGTVSVLYREDSSSLGLVGGTAAVAMGIVVGALAVRRFAGDTPHAEVSAAAPGS